MFFVDILNDINDKDINDILEVWESSVRATHTFLSEEDIIALVPFVKEGALSVDVLLCARDSNDNIKGFMGIVGNKIEMLFVSDECRGLGIGRKLLYHGFSIYNVQYVDVNEQNTQAVEFYKYMDFEVFDRSELDDQGNPFPILHMKLKLFSL